MAEGGDAPDESIFDLSKKKKKKKQRDDPTSTEKEADENPSSEPTTVTTKEKKSKNVAFTTETLEDQENVNAEQAAGGDDDDENDILPLRRKKKKSKARDATAGAPGAGENDILTETTTGTGNTDTTSDAAPVQGEYSYNDLLLRVFNIIRERNPNVGEDHERIKLILKPPQVARIGTKRTAFSNFGEICRSLKRQEKHLHQYSLAELGTNGSIDANSALIIKGRFQQKQIENVLRSYIKEYVICKTCRSADTSLQKEERLTVLFCNTCRSRYFVSGIKTGFQAQVGKRAATRAKAT